LISWRVEWGRGVLTISPNLANAGGRVGGASRWRSMPSNTSTNLLFPFSDAVQLERSLLSSTTSCERFSQRPTGPFHSTALATAPTVCSSRCLPVMHSALLTMAYRRLSCGVSPLGVPLVASCSVASSSRIALVIELFPVASRPWRMIFRLGAART
jgi:hypothetical protein